MSKAASIKSESLASSPIMTAAEGKLSCQLDACQVKVLLVPLTQISEKRLRFYQKVITECHSEIAVPNSISGKHGVVSQLNLTFVSEIDPIANDFIDFQLYFRTFAVIGLVAATELNDGLEALLVKFNSVLEQFSYPVCARIFILDCDESIASLTVPFAAIPMKDISGTLDAQFAAIGSDIVSVMTNLHDSLSARSVLPSPCGIEDFAGTGSRPSGRSRMKVSSRLQKLTADLHVLTGMYSEAVACYAIAAEDAKSSNDLIWQTAALEGFQIAICLQNESLSNIIDSNSYRVLVEKLLPLAIQYEKSGIPMLSVLLQLNCAKLLHSIGLNQQALSIISDAWKSSTLLVAEDRLISLKRILHGIGEMEFRRKWAYYACQLALNLKAAHEFDSAIETFSMALKEYSARSGWDSIKMTVLKELLKISENSSNRLLYFLFAWKCLSMCSGQLDGDEQIRLLDLLRKRSKSDIFCLPDGLKNFSDLPIFVSLHLNQANDGLNCSTESPGDDQGAFSPYGPFIYAPNQEIGKRLRPSTSLICNEVGEFKAIFKNPFVFPIQLRNIRLLIDGCDAECDTVSLLIPPQTSQFTAVLQCKPSQAGSLRLSGVSLTFLSVRITYPIEDLKFTVIPSQPILRFTGSEFDKHIQVYEGEDLHFNLPLEKHLNSELRSLNVSFAIQEANAPLGDRIESLIFDVPLSTSVQAVSELANFSTSIPVLIHGHPMLQAFTANILYSGGDRFWRRLEVPFHCHLQPVLRVFECEFFPGKERSTCILSLYIGNCLEDTLSLFVNGDDYCKLTNRAATRIFLPIPRLCLDDIDLERKLPFSEKQVAMIRKLKHSDTADFLDDGYQEQLYEPLNFYIKKHLIENVKLTWKLGSSQRTGKISLARISLDPKQYKVISYHVPLVAPEHLEYTATCGEPVNVVFSAKAFDCSVEFRLIPLVDLGNGMMAVNYEDVLLLSGPLVSIIQAHEKRTFTFIPISTANFIIKYEIVDSKTGIRKPLSEVIHIKTIN